MPISQSIRNSVIGLSCLAASGLAFAGGPDQMPAPMSSVYFGVGGSFTGVQSDVAFSESNAAAGNVLSSNGRANFNGLGVDPYMQLGWLYNFAPNMMFGVRLDYTYLDATATGGNSGAGNVYSLNYDHLLKLLFQWGLKMGQNDTMLLGVGPNLLNSDFGVQDVTTGSGYWARGSRWSWGFTGAVDYMHHFSDAFFLDLGYSYSYNYVDQGFTNVGRANVAANIDYADARRAAIQQFTASLNYNFCM